MSKKVVFFSLCLIYSLTHAGPFVSGGGDWAAADFASYIQRSIQLLDLHGAVTIDGFKIDPKRLTSQFRQTFIKSTRGPLRLNGSIVTAINTPAKNEILVDRDIWQNLPSSEKQQIAIHEILGLTYREISDANYNYSFRLFRIVQTMESRTRGHYWQCQCFENMESGSAIAGTTLVNIGSLYQAEQSAKVACERVGLGTASNIIARCLRFTGSH